MMEMWKAAYPCLEKVSVKKTLHFKFLASEVGSVYHHCPKFLEVRFRYCIRLAMFFEEHDREIYVYFWEIAARYQSGGPAPSWNEATVINVYLGDWIRIRLCHMFLIAAGDIFLKFIEFFENKSVRIHLVFPKTVLLLSQLFSYFLKDGDRDRLAPKRLLEVDYKAADMQLSLKNLYIGTPARNFIRKTTLSCESPEFREFFQGVRDFYQASAGALVKYAKNTLTNPFVAALQVLDPASKEKMEMAEQRRKWGILASQLCHIVDDEAKVKLLTEELVAYQRLEPAEPGCEADEWWAQVSKVELGGELQFPIITKLALACCTIPASSSEAERDFSAISNIFADSKVSNHSQEMLEAKMITRSAEKAERKNCARCLASDKERKERLRKGEPVSKERVHHCHCSLLEVDETLLADLRTFQPAKMFAVEKEESKRRNQLAAKMLEENKAKEVEKAEMDFKKEVAGFKKRFLDSRANAVREGGDVSKVKVPRKRIGIEKVGKEEHEKKRQKLAFLFEENNSQTGKEGSGASKRREKVGESGSSINVGENGGSSMAGGSGSSKKKVVSNNNRKDKK